MVLVDTHCHLDFPVLREDLNDVLRRAITSDVESIITIGIDPESWQRTQTITDRHSDRVVAAYGLHPNAVAEHWSKETPDQLAQLLRSPQVVALGEIGLDFYRGEDSVDLQREAFVSQLGLARDFDLPVIIHMRQAEDEALEILKQFAPLKGVMHSFASDLSFAQRCLDFGLMLGVGGISTFPSAKDVRAALKECPVDRLILETDAPFLAPQPFRGKPNQPAFVRETAEHLATVLDMNIDEIATATTTNAQALFGDRLSEIVAGTEADR